MRRLASRRIALAVVSVGLAWSWWSTLAGAQEGCEEVGCVVAIEVTGLIDPIIEQFVTDQLDEVESTPGVVGLVLQLDSPGVVLDDDDFSALVGRLVASPVPVSAWVGTGSEATGGAAELVAALENTSMAPGSALGDVGPVRLDRAVVADPFGDEYGRVADETISAGEARDAGIVDRVEPTVGDHLVDLPGVETETVDDEGEPRRQPVTRVIVRELDLLDQVFHTVASPAVAYLALGIGIGLLIFEFFTAGVGVAGVVGAVSLLFAGYGLGVLPVQGWALGLLVVAGMAFMIDVQAGVPRLWTIIGLCWWIVGSVFLFEEVGRPWVALAVGMGGMAVAMLSGMPAMVRARFGTPTIGRESMIGTMGEATTPIDPDGTVRIAGGSWRARTNRLTPVATGDPVRVVAIDGLTLEVEPEEGGAVDYRELRGRRREQEPTAGDGSDRSRE